MPPFTTGQRWISESEPELGLGTLVQVTEDRVHVLFPASGQLRQYARDNAPLRRVHFRKGDVIQDADDRTMTVTGVEESNGLLTYVGEDRKLPEAQLSDRISFHHPEDRLFGLQVDDPDDFRLRRRTLRFQHQSRKSPVRGFVGGRIDLIPHQLYIAHEVSSRQAPRVLLSDEVGLGKTIEACLILHRMLLTGRAARILVLVPDSLVHQWFVEMLRRFNLWLNIFDEERCAAIEAGQPDANPFLDDQVVLCSLDFLAGSAHRADQAIDAGWDILVVDEAHHLEWTPDQPSPEYDLVDKLSRQAEGLLLLTATPEQLGPESHFARLRLLDPDRYGDFNAFQSEAGHYQDVAAVIDKLKTESKLTAPDRKLIKAYFKGAESKWTSRLKELEKDAPGARTRLIHDLLDRHGPGRVLFRNTRSAMSGFPKRCAHLAPVTCQGNKDEWLDRLSTEFAVDAGDTDLQVSIHLQEDPRIPWLVALLKELAPQKVLLICCSPEKVLALDEALRQKIQIKSGVFHEGLTLVQRDRNAAWFAGEEDVRLLICSEIGSEGRNFQFAHHLVLFDLPLNPELLEQRIGRLDRIGQTEDIHIHVPYLEGSSQEVLVRWYHEGLNAFETSLQGGHELLHAFGRQVHDLALEFPEATPREAARELKSLLQKTSQARTKMEKVLEKGRDRLLEWNSFRPETAATLVNGIQAEDRDDALQEYMLDIFEHYGVHAEELGPRTFHLNPQGVVTDAFPSIPEEGLIVTLDRKQALGREDVGFLTWDHPMVTGAMDLNLGSEKGNSSFVFCSEDGPPGLWLETLFVLEPIAQGNLHADRFLPATPIRIVVDHETQDATGDWPERDHEPNLQKAPTHVLADRPEIVRDLIPRLLDEARSLAQAQADACMASSLQTMSASLDQEQDRLESLKAQNDHIRPDEIERTRQEKADLTEALRTASLRLDAIRLIWRGP